MTLQNSRMHTLALALVLATASVPVFAQQHHDHSEHAPTTSAASENSHAGHSMHTRPISQEGEEKTRSGQDDHSDHSEMDHSKMDHSSMNHSEMDHSGMDHSGMDHSGMDHSGMDHSGMEHSGMDHSGMDHSRMDHSRMDHSKMGHSAMDHSSVPYDLPPDAPPREPIPPVTDGDRAAAFPELASHLMHGESINSYVLIDRLETSDASEAADPFAWEVLGWVGTDLNRFWFRSEGELFDSNLESGDIELLYGRAVARWWDAVVGIRHDFGEGPSRTFAAFGLMGLAPYMFEVEATAYIGEGGQTGLGVEAEYEMLFTNRLIAQWLVEAEAWGRDDPRRGIGSGLSTVEAGVRLRYEIDRQFAPYIGIMRERAFGGTADLRRAGGVDIDDTRVVAGVRIWF